MRLAQSANDELFSWRKSSDRAHVPQRGFYGSEDYVESEIYQVNACQGDDDVPPQHHALVQHVVENVEQGHPIAGIVSSENHGVGSRAHIDFTLSSGRETNE